MAQHTACAPSRINVPTLPHDQVQAFREGRLSLSPEDLAIHWGVKVERIYELVKERRLRGTKVGRLIRFDWNDVEEYRKRNRTVSEW
jgi:excisionase family DNA binding protein